MKNPRLLFPARAPRPFGLSLLLVLLCVSGSGCHKDAPVAAGAEETKAAETKDAGAADGKEEATLPTVEAVTVHRGSIAEGPHLTGRLMAARENEAAVAAPVAGVLGSLPVRLGQTVSRNQIVAHLSTRTLQGQMDQARAAIAQSDLQVQQARVNALQQEGQTRSAVLQAQSAVTGAQATLRSAEATLTGNQASLDNARQSLARLQALFKDGLVAQKEVEAGQLAVRSAQAQVTAQQQVIASQKQGIAGLQQSVAAARAAGLQDQVKRQEVAIARQQGVNARGALETAIAQQALYTVRSPLTGTVTAVGASLGETVDPATKLVTITNLDRLQLQIAVPADAAAAVHAGQAVRFTLDSLPGKTFSAVIRTVGTQVDPASNTLTAIAEVANTGHLFKDDSFVQVQIVTRSRSQSLLLPRRAVFFDAAEAGTGSGGDGGAQAIVLKLDKENTLHKITVTTGLISGDQIEIRGDMLKPGDRVAATGGYGLEDGAKVTVKDEEKAAP